MKIKILGVLFLATFLSSCAKHCVTVNQNSPVSNQPAHLEGHDIGSGLSNEVKVYAPIGQRDYNNFLEAKINFQNLTDSNQNIQYQLQWLDGNGFATGETTAWSPVSLMAEQSKTVLAVANTKSANFFRVNVCKLN